MRPFIDRLEPAETDDCCFDYCLWTYDPLCDQENKLRSANLLYHSFEVAGISNRYCELVSAIRKRIGQFQTVFGIKQAGGDLFWEFYFYDYQRRHRHRSMTRVIEAFAPFARCSVQPNERLHYFMFSIDVDQALIAGERDLDEIHMYIGNPGSAVSSGICYSLTATDTRLENFYFFFDAKRHREDIVAKINCSAYYDPTHVKLEEILWPEMEGCRVIVVANKQGNDSVYFSRINVQQLIFFLKQMAYPDAIVSFIEERRHQFDHLLYDVGFDYRLRNGNLAILKSGYYGYF